MALKDDIESIKNDLVGESRFLEQYIKIEDYFKKHKKKILTVAGIVLVLLIGNYLSGVMEMNKKLAANEAYLEYVKTKDASKLDVIKEKNPALYTLLSLQKAVSDKDLEGLKKLSSSDIRIVADLAKYHVAILSNDTKTIADYTMEENALLKDFASLQLAYKLYSEGKQKEARDALKKIAFESQLKKSANYLEHYGLNQ